MYIREAQGHRYLVALNLGHDPHEFATDDSPSRGRIVLSTHPDREGEETNGHPYLRPDEGLIVELFTNLLPCMQTLRLENRQTPHNHNP